MLKNYLKTGFRTLIRHKGYSALNILRQQNLGYNKEQVMSFRLPGNMREKIDLIKTTFEKNSSVLYTGAASVVPSLSTKQG